jgi:hypothetical protein
MRQTIVPAQITTVEDRIFGNISFQQLGLLLAPVLCGILIFALLPPVVHFTPYKLLIILVLAIIFWTAAIRFYDKLLIYWVVLIYQYKNRPKYYVHDVNDAHLRRSARTERTKPVEAITPKVVKKTIAVPEVALHDAIRIRELMNDPRASLRFMKNKRGELHAIINEIK